MTKILLITYQTNGYNLWIKKTHLVSKITIKIFKHKNILWLGNELIFLLKPYFYIARNKLIGQGLITLLVCQHFCMYFRLFLPLYFINITAITLEHDTYTSFYADKQPYVYPTNFVIRRQIYCVQRWKIIF